MHTMRRTTAVVMYLVPIFSKSYLGTDFNGNGKNCSRDNLSVLCCRLLYLSIDTEAPILKITPGTRKYLYGTAVLYLRLSQSPVISVKELWTQYILASI